MRGYVSAMLPEKKATGQTWIGERTRDRPAEDEDVRGDASPDPDGRECFVCAPSRSICDILQRPASQSDREIFDLEP
jgi:hypothetical protein